MKILMVIVCVAMTVVRTACAPLYDGAESCEGKMMRLLHSICEIYGPDFSELGVKPESLPFPEVTGPFVPDCSRPVYKLSELLPYC